MSKTMPVPDMIPVFAATTLKLHPEKFMLVSLPLSEKETALELFKGLDPFSTISIDHAEVSLILKQFDWGSIQSGFAEFQSEGPFRAITFDIVLDLNLVGFLSVVSSILAEEGISIFAVSTFLRDHILIKANDVDHAIDSINILIQRCKNTQ